MIKIRGAHPNPMFVQLHAVGICMNEVSETISDTSQENRAFEQFCGILHFYEYNMLLDYV